MARQLDLLRVYQVVLNRFGRPTTPRSRLIVALRPALSGREPRAERRARPVARLPPSARTPRPRRSPCWSKAPTQEEQIDYAQALRIAQDRLDARAAQGVLLLVPQGRPVQGGQQLPRLHGEHQARRDRQPERRREGRAQADPRGQARRGGPAAPVRRPAVRQEVDARRAGAHWSSGAEGPRLRPRPRHCSPRPSASPAIASTTRAAGSGPTSRASPAGSAPATCSSRSSCPARRSATSTRP